MKTLLLAYLTYGIAVAAPGPSVLAIMALAMREGRRPAVLFALGVMLGSTIWALASALGLSLLLAKAPAWEIGIRMVGGAYLCWMGIQAYRAAFTAPSQAPSLSRGRYFWTGLGLHITNPKAMLVWSTMVSMGLSSSLPNAVWLVVAGCLALGVLICVGYAWAFSLDRARAAYARFRKQIQLGVALVLFAMGLYFIQLAIVEFY